LGASLAATKAVTYKTLGTDLAVTHHTGAPANIPLEVADTWGSVDLSVVPGGRGGLRLTTSGPICDLGVVGGRGNLAQALILRLVTPKGSLAGLGHPDYGSRLIELIGSGNTDNARNLARLFTLEALKQEPRIAQILDLAVQTAEGQPDTVRIGFSVVPVNDDDPIGLALEVQL